MKKKHPIETSSAPMFSETVIKKVGDVIWELWKDYDSLANQYRDYGMGNGHPGTVLKSAEEFEKLLRMSKSEAIRNVFGMGGNGYVTLEQQVERFRWRICIGFYRSKTTQIPEEVELQIEHLCSMDQEDAKYYAEKYETAQWGWGSPQTKQPVNKKKRKKTATFLLTFGWILFWFYIFLFAKSIVLKTGIFYTAPSNMIMIGCLFVVLLSFAQALRADGPNGFVLFLVIASLIYSIVFCAAIYNPGGFFQMAFWSVCLPMMIRFIIFVIIGRILGAIVKKIKA